ncbi:S-adenosylmethionine decarboxylase proenzyme [Paenibacillus ferrarius]|uniref:S-adenosylmethionine decarboxylase proenzyme n=1 Tax=Paenibacillus ferrarius TaxID=1469647 RepID=A0A1V4HMV4_9BACL|nr:adenosylmethionine decarboxylase [Paenibacillus ferrarius]OPH58465.1 S-adenosylmethionine decarboxylase proenzyme [Paenibacillus ferrarius]
MEYSTYGRHVAVDAWGVAFDNLNSADRLCKQMVQAAEASGATILSIQSKQFEPQGATVLLLLSESHMSIHTYPEKGFAALDCYTCGETVDPQVAIQAMLDFLQPLSTSLARMTRGMGALHVSTTPADEASDEFGAADTSKYK